MTRTFLSARKIFSWRTCHLAAPSCGKGYRRPLRIELLEDRQVPTTITPTTFDDGGLGSGSLRDAVLQFNADTGTDDDIIQLESGTYSLTIQNVGGHHETAGLTGDLNLNQTSHRWIIQGAGSSGDNVTIIDAGQLQDRVLQILNPGTHVVFQNLVIQGGLAQEDGSDGALQGTTDALGGGIFNNAGDLTLDDVVVQNNVARGGDAAFGAGHSARGGGFYSTGGALTISRVTIANNEASGGRGGFAQNGGLAAGGGLYATGGSLDISNSMIGSNRATGGRGGDGYSYTTQTPSGSHHYYGGNGGAGQGGGLYVNGSSLSIASSSIASNQGIAGSGGDYGYAGDGYGGGLCNGGTLTVSNSTLSSNSATYGSGGGIYNSGTLTVTGSTLSGNSANNGGYGGGIYNANSSMVTLSNSTVSGNSATYGSGGGISNSGTLTVSNSTLSGNSATGEWGGGIINYGTLTVSNSTLSGNSANYGGGGIYTSSSRPVTLTNVTLTANRANTGGGGLLVHVGSTVLHNTLIAGNFRGATGTTRDDVSGSLDAGGDYNLIGDGTGMTGLSNGVNGNLVGSADAPIDPLLGPLQDNGGLTLTHALLPGSPAIDAGNNDYTTDWDQRGPRYPRIVNGIIDIGAFEYQGDGSGAAAFGEARSEQPSAAALLSGLPAQPNSPTVVDSAAFAGIAPAPNVTLDIAPGPERPSAPEPASVDRWFASVHKEEQVPTASRWPTLESLPPCSSSPDPLREQALFMR